MFYTFLILLVIVAGCWMMHHHQTGKQGKRGVIPYGVAAAHPEAVRVGMEVLEEGGNAVDAAIAISYCLGVVEPFASGIGGGGTLLIHPNQEGKNPIVYDYRETAPRSSPSTSPQSAKGVGVPGMVRGMERIHRRMGTLPMKRLLQPAIDLAEKGFEVTAILSSRLQTAESRIDIAALPHFYPGGKPIQPGQRLKQPALAATLKNIQSKGAMEFYQGETARHIEQLGCGVNRRDLLRYRIVAKKPLRVKVAGYEVFTSSPPGGGVMLAQALRMVEEAKGRPAVGSALWIHRLGEIQKRVHLFSTRYLGDPAFVPLATKEMITPRWIQHAVSKINDQQISSREEIIDSLADKEDHDNTTHFVIVDRGGQMVSATHTLSNFFGSGLYVDGFFLNDQLKHFSISPTSPNAMEPGKRPVNYTAPTILARKNKPVIGIGSAGGNRITSVLTEVIVRLIYQHESMQQAIDHPRVVVQGGVVYVEQALPGDVTKSLTEKGYQIKERATPFFYGGVQGIKVDLKQSQLDGGFDRRRGGSFQSGS